MGAHNAGRKVWAPGRWRWLNRTVEALLVTALVTAAALAGWISHEPAPTGSTLNPPVHLRITDRPEGPGVAPITRRTDPPPPAGTNRRKD